VASSLVLALLLVVAFIGAIVAVLQNWIPRPSRLRLLGRYIAVTNGRIIAAIGVGVVIIWGLTTWIGKLESSDGNHGNPPSDNSPPQSHSQETIVVDAPSDPSLPYMVNRPAPQSPSGQYPHIEVSLTAIANRGHPVPVSITGSDFVGNGNYRVELFTPEGSTAYVIGGETDDRGLFQESVLWTQYRDLNIDGNNGAWKLRVSDLVSGNILLAQINVTSDASTPPPSEWIGDRKPTSDPSMSLSSQGRLCAADGVTTTMYLSGFTPDAYLRVDYLRADGERVAMRGLVVDGAGEVALVTDHWRTQNCSSTIEFHYRVVVTEENSGRIIKGGVVLITR
jgi:hypothetical protein